MKQRLPAEPFPLPLRERPFDKRSGGPAKREGEGARAAIAIVATRRVTPHPPVADATGPSLSRKGRGEALRTAGDLLAAGLIDESRRAEIDAVAREFALAITPDMAALIDPADPADPIAAQFVPQGAELTVAPEERADPIGDA